MKTSGVVIGTLATWFALGTVAHADDRGDEHGVRTPVVKSDDHVSKILFLNRCQGGCLLQPGPNDARFNTSRIVAGPSLVSEWRHGDAAWQELVQCVKEVYAPYDVQVTDVDPGEGIFHHEAIVAGDYSEIGYETPVGGVAPSQCNPANNVISFTFANGYGNWPVAICSTVAQETAHSYGLEHAFDCSDPMTYLQACGRQFFRDATTPCGEFEERECQCGGTAQNSHRWLKTVLGENPNPVGGPRVQVIRPADGDTVDSGFSIAVDAQHMRGIGTVEFVLNGTVYGSLEGHGPSQSSQAYWFDTPADLSDGIIDIEIRATNDIGGQTIELLSVTKGAPCSSADQCNAGQECNEGRCAYPPATGELGASCATDMQCESGLCTMLSDGTAYCSQTCFPSTQENTCPDGFYCLGVNASEGYCLPAAEESGGCRAVGASGSTGGWLAILLALGIVRRRRS